MTDFDFNTKDFSRDLGPAFETEDVNKLQSFFKESLEYITITQSQDEILNRMNDPRWLNLQEKDAMHSILKDEEIDSHTRAWALGGLKRILLYNSLPTISHSQDQRDSRFAQEF